MEFRKCCKQLSAYSPRASGEAMTKANRWVPLLVLAFGGTVVHANTVSYTGTLVSPEDSVEFCHHSGVR
jgi:hypothetical protein